MKLHKPYINFHTHQSSNDDKVMDIFSFHFDSSNDLKLPNSYFTIGRHPWYTNSTLQLSEKERFIQILKNNFCIGIGEIGLDKYARPSKQNQEKFFYNQLTLAQDYQKPVVIHCVKAFDKLIEMKKMFPKIKKWCIHGFLKNHELAKQLLKHGFYLSIGKINKNNEKDVKLLNTITLDKLFLETDNSTNKIKDIYIETAEIKRITIKELQQQIKINTKDFFTNG